MSAPFLNKPLRGTQLKPGHPLVNGLKVCWLANAGDGVILTDLSRNLEGSIQGGASWSKGKLLFDGVDGYVESGDFTAFFDPANPWSLCVNNVVINAWDADYQTFGSICHIFDGVTNEYVFVGCDNSATGLLKIGTAGKTPGTGSALVLDTIYNFCLTWDGTQFSAYINGKFDFSVIPSSAIVWTDINSMMSGGASVIGTLAHTAAISIDSQLLYDRLLNDNEIAAISNDPNQIFEPSWDIAALELSSSAPAYSSAEISWRIINSSARSLAYNIFIGVDVDTAWRDITRLASGTGFNILADSNISSKWGIKTAISQNIANHILAKIGQELAFNILTGSFTSAAWNMMAGVDLDTAWAISLSKAINLAWKIKAELSNISAWHLLTSREQATVARILADVGLSSAWNIGGLADIIKIAQRHIFEFDKARRVFEYDTIRRILK